MVPRKIQEVFWESVVPLEVISSLLYLFAAIGIYFRRDKSFGDMYLILHIAPWYVWSALALYCTSSRVINSLVLCKPMKDRVVTPVIGMALWAMLLTASAAYPDDFGMGLLYIVALLLETWVLARILAEG